MNKASPFVPSPSFALRMRMKSMTKCATAADVLMTAAGMSRKVCPASASFPLVCSLSALMDGATSEVKH